jgi:hypothetical protein
VRGELRGPPRHLPRSSTRSWARSRAYLRLLLDTLFALGVVSEVPELLAGLGFEDGIHRFFDGLATSVCPGLRLAHQDFVRHLADALIFAHGAPLLAETLHAA